MLSSFDVSPQLPAGYASMLVAALIPPLWRRPMDHRVPAHYDGDATRADTGPHVRARTGVTAARLDGSPCGGESRCR